MHFPLPRFSCKGSTAEVKSWIVLLGFNDSDRTAWAQIQAVLFISSLTAANYKIPPQRSLLNWSGCGVCVYGVCVCESVCVYGICIWCVWCIYENLYMVCMCVWCVYVSVYMVCLYMVCGVYVRMCVYMVYVSVHM